MNENIELRRKTLEAIHDSAVDAIITITDRGIIETVNPATETLFGYSADELIGSNVSKLMPEPYRSEHDSYLASYFQTGVARIIGIGREVVARRKDGTIFPMHLAVSQVELGGRTVFAGFIRDHTDLKKYEEQQASLGRIIEDSLNEVFIFDPVDFFFIQVNRGARQNLGYTLEELQRITPVDIKPNFDLQTFRALVQPLLNGEVETLAFSTTHQRKDGTHYEVDVNLQASTYLSKPVLVAIILDVTKRRMAERQVRRHQEEMRSELERQVEQRTSELRETQAELLRSEKFATLGKVSGGIAHEIRNPLNAVKTSAYFLLNAKQPSPEKMREHLERIDRQVAIVDNVITALSDVAKLPEATLTPISLERLLRSVVGSMTIPANIKQDIHLPDSIPAVNADEHQITIAFKNLIRNARDAMPEGGTLTVKATVNASTVDVDVIDTGLGIPEREQDRVMEPLYTTKARGMGLGLPITQAIVEKNLGVLSFESEEGVGSRFRISLTTNEN